MSGIKTSPGPAPAQPQLLILNRWEELLPGLFELTGRFPKSLRFSLSRRVEERALGILEALVAARFRKAGRLHRLRAIDLDLDRIRRLLRLAQARGALSQRGFAKAIGKLDEVGRMLHGWRQAEESA